MTAETVSDNRLGFQEVPDESQEESPEIKKKRELFREKVASVSSAPTENEVRAAAARLEEHFLSQGIDPNTAARSVDKMIERNPAIRAARAERKNKYKTKAKELLEGKAER